MFFPQFKCADFELNQRLLSEQMKQIRNEASPASSNQASIGYSWEVIQQLSCTDCRLVLSRRGRRLSWLKSGDKLFLKIE